MSDTKLTRLERKANEIRPKTITLEAARKDWRKLMEWAHGILDSPEGEPPDDDRSLDAGQRFALIAAKGGDDDPFFDSCLECRDRMQKGDTHVISLWAWHILAHHRETADLPPSDATRVAFENLEAKAPDVHAALRAGILKEDTGSISKSDSVLDLGVPSAPPADSVAADHTLTDRLRQAASESPTSSVPASDDPARDELAHPENTDPERAPDWAWGAHGDESLEEWRRRFKPPKSLGP